MSNWIPLDISRVLRPEDVTTKPCKHETTTTTTTLVTPPATKARVSESSANTSTTTTTAEILSLSLQAIRTIRKRSISLFHTATTMAKRSESTSTER